MSDSVADTSKVADTVASLAAVHPTQPAFPSASHAEETAEDADDVPPPTLDKLVDESDAVVQTQDAETGGAISTTTNDNLELGDWDSLPIPPALMNGITAKGFKKPSKIQARALPALLGSNRNIIGQAQNGSGKTATFSLGLLGKVDVGSSIPQALIVVPTRELVMQTVDVIHELGKFMDGLKVLSCYGGEKYSKDDCKVAVIVGTLGKIEQLAKQKYLVTNSLRMFIVDEVDYFLKASNNQAAQLVSLRKLCPQAQVALFSATFNPKVRNLVEDIAVNPVRIIVNKTVESLNVNTIAQMYVKIDGDDFSHKIAAVKELFACLPSGQTIIFVKERAHGVELCKQLEEMNTGVALIMGNNKENGSTDAVEKRDKVLKEFKEGKTKVLIGTDVIARGLDVPNVTLVVNTNIPVDYYSKEPEFDTFLHRIARTGRFGKWGTAVSLVTGREYDLLMEIKNHYKSTMTEVSLDDPEELENKIKEVQSRKPIVVQQNM